MGMMISVVLLPDDAPASVKAITEDIELRWTNLPYATRLEGDGDTLSFALGALSIVVGRMPAPYPWSALEGPCSTSVLWPTAAEEIKPLGHHWIVTVSGEEKPVELSLMLTKITASVLATCPSAVGVYWGNSTLVLPKGLFVEVAAASSLGDPPMQMWVDFRVGWDSRKTSSGFTQGMRSLGHMDFETQNAPESPAHLAERLVALAGYVVTGKGVIRDGDTVGTDAREKIRVSYAKSAFGNEHEVMRLTFEPAPRWKLW